LFNVVFLTLIHTLLFIVGAVTTVSASPAERLDYAFSNIGAASFAFGIEMLIAGFAAQVISTVFPRLWGGRGALQPSPAEKSIETRFVSGAGAIISTLLVLLLVGAWVTAGSAARRLLEDRLASAAQLSAQAIPQFLESGQSLSTQIASDPRLAQASDGELQTVLGELIRSAAFFNQLAIVDISTNLPLTSYPAEPAFQLTGGETAGLPLLSQGILNQQLATSSLRPRRTRPHLLHRRHPQLYPRPHCPHRSQHQSHASLADAHPQRHERIERLGHPAG
jgi:hypothetical protein